jgi:hypothetical protein
MTTTVQTPETFIDGPFGARLLIEAGDFSLVEHPIAPRTLAGPSHVHQHEDEYSYVLEGLKDSIEEMDNPGWGPYTGPNPGQSARAARSPLS